jgi:dimethylamine/trimethylamine dehydrogenase
MDERHRILFEPIEIGPKMMKNRFCQVPQCNGAGSERPRGQASHRAVKVDGGWGAVFIEYCSIHPESDGTTRVSARLWDDDDIRNLAVTCDAIHQGDALAGVELYYGGPVTTCQESRAVRKAPSQIPGYIEQLTYPQEMDLDDIAEVQGYYVKAAENARRAGFDIVYIYAAHEMLPAEFLSPHFNKRTDEYGGSLENRARFLLETLARVRDAIGDDTAVGVRISSESLAGDGGLQLNEDVLPMVRLADDLVDVWDVTVYGGLGDEPPPSRFYPEAYQLRWQAAIKQATNKPVIGVGRFTNPDTMANAIRSGQLDIIGAARPSIADPFIPKKIEEGRVDEIRECIGCNICIACWRMHRPAIICTQNATIGEEYRRGWHPERFEPARNADSDVLIVGAGPAGMECATILGKRGMRRVHLVDAHDDLGGIMRWIPKLPGLGEWGRVVDYRRIQLDKLKNVEFIRRTNLNAEAVAEYGADLVIVATGATWAGDGLNGYSHEPIPGADATQPHVLTPEQIMVEGKVVVGKNVVIVDHDGYFMAVSLAEKLALEGKAVTVLTQFQAVAPFMRYTGEQTLMRRKFREMGVAVQSETIATSIRPGFVQTRHTAEGHEAELEADAIVLVTQRQSNHGLYRELKDVLGPERLAEEGIIGLYRIGDCVAPRLIADAIFDGHRLAREIDSDDAHVWKPYLRERAVVG